MEKKEYCWVSRTAFERLEEAEGAGGVVRDIAVLLKFSVVSAFLYAKTGYFAMFPWNPIVKQYLPEIACEDIDNCYDGIVWFVEDINELGEAYEVSEYAIEGTILAKLYCRKGFTKVYKVYDGSRKAIALCTSTKPMICVALFEEDDC